MNRISLISFATLALFTITPAQNGDRDSADSPSGMDENAGTLDPHEGANAAVPDSIKANSMGTFIFTSSLDAFTKAMTSKGAITIQPDTSGALLTIDGDFNGEYSGRVLAKGTVLRSSITKTMFVDLILTFHNYSLDGHIFEGGELHAEEIINSAAPFAKIITYIDGNIRFNGSRVGIDRFSDLLADSSSKKILNRTSVTVITSDSRVFVNRYQQ